MGELVVWSVTELSSELSDVVKFILGLRDKGGARVWTSEFLLRATQLGALT